MVTFCRLPSEISQAELATRLGAVADHNSVKGAYHVDGYLVHLGMQAERLAQQSAYWYSVWSHRRSQLWKGFVQVDLAPIEDGAATGTLASMVTTGGHA